MSINNSLVTDALAYYDENVEKYKHVFDNVKYMKYSYAENDNDHSTISFYDEYQKILFSSRFEYIGSYSAVTTTWKWAWAGIFKRNLTNIIRKILNYGAELEQNMKVLKTELITSVFVVNDEIQLDIHVAIASYLSKKPLIFQLPVGLTSWKGDTHMNDILIPKTDVAVIDYLFLLDYDQFTK
jgi:hypothetical protein